MLYPFTHPGFERQQLAIELPHVFADARLIVNGQRPPRGPKKRTFVLRRDDGAEVVATLERSKTFVDPIPPVLIEGTRHEVAPPMPWYEVVACWLPIVLLLGGAIGGLRGGLAVVVSSRVFRSGWEPWLAWGGVLAVIGGVFVAFAILSTILFVATH